MNTTVQKWGNSYAVRLPKAAVQKLNLRSGTPVEICESAHNDGTLSITPVRRSAATLAEMSARITKKNSHRAADWGNAAGSEVW